MNLEIPTPAGQSFIIAAWVFLRCLGLIYCIAFVSLGVQVKGLVGQNGILPAKEMLFMEKRLWEQRAHFLFPTLCWWNCSDRFLQFLCWGGAVLALLLVFGFAPLPILILLWLFYLSLLTVCGKFLGYQWDALLLEVGFVSILFAPLEFFSHWPGTAPATIALWLLYLVLFRLMFASGVAKLLGGDMTWRNFTALKFHYETQPLPTRLAWYAHRFPCWFQKLSVVLMLLIETIVPLLFFAPSPVREGASLATIVLMVFIMATGSYCFFNLLTIALCLLLFDDRDYGALFSWLHVPLQSVVSRSSSLPDWILLPVAAVLLFLSIDRLLLLFGFAVPWPKPLRTVEQILQRFCLVNSYGLFTVMTLSRPEIIVEGSNDGENWLAYEFKFKPGDLKRPPRSAQPHQPRLDWQMWFAAFSPFQNYTWFGNFCVRLLQGEPTVLALLRHNPFPHEPPKFIRSRLYEYRFTDLKTRREKGVWWTREFNQEYGAVVSLRGAAVSQ